jgi:hypothetical protein
MSDLDEVVKAHRKVDRLHDAVLKAAYSQKVQTKQKATTQCSTAQEFQQRFQEYWYALSEEIYRELPPHVREAI